MVQKARVQRICVKAGIWTELETGHKGIYVIIQDFSARLGEYQAGALHDTKCIGADKSSRETRLTDRAPTAAQVARMSHATFSLA